MNSPSRASQVRHQLLQGWAFLSLLCLGGVLHLHEVPGYEPTWRASIWGFAATYLPLWIEAMCLAWVRAPFVKSHIAGCVLPPLRLIARHSHSGQFWLPGRGWFEANDDVREQLERSFSVPMILFALLVLPLTGLEMKYRDQIQAHAEYRLAAELTTTTIWVAFCIEFLVMFSVQEKRLRYCIRHWLDLLIILLPLVAFLRAVRLGRLLRLQKLTQGGMRAYQMRGALVRLQRTFMLMSVVKRILHARPEARLRSLREKLGDKEREILAIRDEITELEAKLAQLAVLSDEPGTKAA